MPLIVSIALGILLAKAVLFVIEAVVEDRLNAADRRKALARLWEEEEREGT